MNWQSWLSDLSQSRCVLVELVHTEGTLYLATMPYQTSPTDTPAHTAYDDVITEMPEISRHESRPVSLGDLAFHSPDAGQLIRYQWQRVMIYLGAPDWPKSSFKRISTSRIERVMRSAVDRVRVEFVDDHQQLSSPLPLPRLYREPAGTVLPFIIGKPFQVQPLNTFPAQLEYAVGTYGGDDEYISIVSVRDNGVPVDYTPVGKGRISVAASWLGWLALPSASFVHTIGVWTMNGIAIRQGRIFASMGWISPMQSSR